MSYIKINKNNYYHNLNECLKRVKNIDKLIIILKDNAYGHGIQTIGELAASFGINFVAVKNQYEAQLIKNKFKNILILSQLAKNYKAESNYILGINDINYLKYLSSGSKIALKLDTGMHRSGIDENMLDTALKEIKSKNLKLVSAYTHYSSSKNINIQKIKYSAMKDFLEQNYDYEIFFHSANSSTLFLGENNIDEAARIGLAQFGYCDEANNLKPVLSLFAEKISSRIVKSGESIGYDESYTATEDIAVANYDLGYGDGLLYYKGNGEFCLENGVKVLGKISMDSFSSYDLEDEVCVFSNAKKYAKYFNTSVYEALVRLNQDIKKVIC